MLFEIAERGDAVAAPHIADVMSDARTVADRIRAEVRLCIPATDGAPVQRRDPYSTTLAVDGVRLP